VVTVTVTLPGVAMSDAGTVALNAPFAFIVVDSVCPATLIVDVFRKPVPVATSVNGPVPTDTDEGCSVVMTGNGLLTVKLDALWPVPIAVVTEIGPDVAPTGTRATI